MEERIDELAIELREDRGRVDPPWPVRWYRWFQGGS
jgi:general stress protein 26